MFPIKAESPNVSTLAEALRAPLLRVSRRLRQEAQKVGLSAHDALILSHIKRNPGMGVSELAEFDQISRPTMSGHIKRLEAAGWLSRAGHAGDGRRSGLRVTPTGVRKLDMLMRHRNDWLVERLLRLAPAEREQLWEAAPALLKLVALDA
jgi:DNA-binding MarR family transcriptional regulator